jgi:1,4-dihydroxy-2-naphthoyl-CoA hydrolase
VPFSGTICLYAIAPFGSLHFMTKLKPVSLETLNARVKNTMMESLGVRFTDIGEDFIEASMPVDHRTYQPQGILHGGASCALAETLGSVASSLVLDLDHFVPVGLEINANHIRSMSSGEVIGRAEPLHIGRTTHVWDIRIRNSENKLVCISRLTVAVVPKR